MPELKLSPKTLLLQTNTCIRNYDDFFVVSVCEVKSALRILSTVIKYLS